MVRVCGGDGHELQEGVGRREGGGSGVGHVPCRTSLGAGGCLVLAQHQRTPLNAHYGGDRCYAAFNGA